MIVVRNCFIAKPGQATKLANMFKEVAAAADIPWITGSRELLRVA